MTWDSNYKVVSHYPNGTTLTSADSTVNAHHGTVEGTVVAGTGKVDGSLSVSNNFATQSGINYGDNSDFDPGAGDFSVSIWANKASASIGFQNLFLVAKYRTGEPIENTEFSVSMTTSGSDDIPQWIVSSGATAYLASATTSMSLSTWYYLTGVREGDNIYLYVNGAREGTAAFGSGLSVNNANRPLTVGDQDNTGFGMDGLADEFRYSSSARSQGWIKTEYNNQNSPSTFLSFGAEITSNTSTNSPFFGSEF